MEGSESSACSSCISGSSCAALPPRAPTDSARAKTMASGSECAAPRSAYTLRIALASSWVTPLTPHSRGHTIAARRSNVLTGCSVAAILVRGAARR